MHQGIAVRKMSNITISLVIPCLNEQDNIASFLESADQCAQKFRLNIEYIFINDGSTDQTQPVLLEQQTRYPHIKIIDLTRNFGKEAALTAGLDHATGDVIVPIDADGQDPIDVVIKMLERWQNGANHVIAIRNDRQSESLFKRASAKLFYKLFNKLSDGAIPENGGDFRLITKDVLNHILTLRETNRFMKGILSWPCAPDATIEFTRPSRAGGNAQQSLRKLLALAFNGLLSFSSWPLRIWGIIGLCISAVSGGYGIIIIVKTSILGRDTPGYASLMATMLFLGGIQLITLSILGEYVSRVFLEVKNRPLYLINKIYTKNESNAD